MSQVSQLYKLQLIDTEIREKTLRLREVLQAQKGNKALAAALGRMETAVSDLNSWQTKHKDLSLAFDGLNNKVKSSENRLYSGKVTNTKELTDLQKEIASLGRRRESLEEEVLEAMVMVEDAQGEKDRAEDALSGIQADWDNETASLKKEQNELALRIHALNGKRKSLATTIPAKALTEYQHIAKRKGGVAVAKLRVNQCMVCQVSASSNKVKDAREGKLVTCGSCGRILHPA
ncbi:MAG: hypothetical protein DWQ04_05335 [Chloroflexi bacterium]|nr:MAG: hypothetical protein DWQ04_05335 [Chloroflexota bacterium]